MQDKVATCKKKDKMVKIKLQRESCLKKLQVVKKNASKSCKNTCNYKLSKKLQVQVVKKMQLKSCPLFLASIFYKFFFASATCQKKCNFFLQVSTCKKKVAHFFFYSILQVTDKQPGRFGGAWVVPVVTPNTDYLTLKTIVYMLSTWTYRNWNMNCVSCNSRLILHTDMHQPNAAKGELAGPGLSVSIISIARKRLVAKHEPQLSLLDTSWRLGNVWFQSLD